MANSVHHIEFGVLDCELFRRYFVEKYAFSVVSERYCDFAKQLVLKSEKACILLTQFLVDPVKDTHSDVTLSQKCISDPYIVPWNKLSGDFTHDLSIPDFSSVHNVALKVKDVQLCVNRLLKSGGQLDNYTGEFLPHFTDAVGVKNGPATNVHFSNFDHVTFACTQGSSQEILQWYERCFGMKRFRINREEDEDNGFIIDAEDIGLRMKAFEYWKCAEVGLMDNVSDSIKFVIAECLYNQGPNQVDTFLNEHGGPGIQHVALYTNKMVDTVAALQKNGVEFVEPPYTYYTEKFTKPLFNRNTFFLEIIQRVGANGFGIGNITALWRSVQAYLSDNKKQKSIVSERYCDFAKQLVLKSGKACILLTQFLVDLVKDTHSDVTLSQKCISDPYIVPWNIFSEHVGDFTHDLSIPDFSSVHNVALKVKDVQLCVNRLVKSGGEVIKPMTTVKDGKGEIKIAIVKSCIGNVIHPLIQLDNYTGEFLPHFTDTVGVKNGPASTCDVHISHFDHVTFACTQGSSQEILQWYERCFGMNRFLINREEDEDSGFVIDTEDIGLRLKAFEYWKCAEVGLMDNVSGSIKFVIAEALANQEHGGPGIQHVGLYTNNMVATIAGLQRTGVEFVEPPYTYYTEILVGKLKDINDIGLEVDVLKLHGILVDAEADPGGDFDSQGPGIVEDASNRYLMQKFTKPLFNRNTFFLEIIQRVGAKGFGSGNITALWRSVQAYLSEKENQQS
ncbi:hypothetical protein KUTeg_004719, partial [Tegillarca granosa]